MYELLAVFKDRDIKVSLKDGKLTTLAPTGAIDNEVAKLIKNHKFELIDFLKTPSTGIT